MPLQGKECEIKFFEPNTITLLLRADNKLFEYILLENGEVRYRKWPPVGQSDHPRVKDTGPDYLGPFLPYFRQLPPDLRVKLDVLAKVTPQAH